MKRTIFLASILYMVSSYAIILLNGVPNTSMSLVGNSRTFVVGKFFEFKKPMFPSCIFSLMNESYELIGKNRYLVFGDGLENTIWVVLDNGIYSFTKAQIGLEDYQHIDDCDAVIEVAKNLLRQPDFEAHRVDTECPEKLVAKVS